MRILTLLIVLAIPAAAQQRDVVYGYKDGMALVLDVFPPQKPNGAGVLQPISGGMRSNLTESRPRRVMRGQTKALLDAGYTVFTVYHGSQPRYTVPEICDDITRAVRFVRQNAARFGVDADRLGIFGFSSGGLLALYAGTAGKDDTRLQAVAAYYPGADLLNFGEEGRTIIDAFRGRRQLRAPFDFREPNAESGLLERVVDGKRIRELLAACSPATYISADDPPFLLLHGDQDTLIPVQQSQRFASLLEKAGVEHKLVLKPGKPHGWEADGEELAMFRAWFDRHLLKKRQ